MEPIFELSGQTLIARLAGEIDLQVSADLRHRLDFELDRTQARHIVFDMSEVNFLDSSGLGVILGRFKRISTRGGQMVLVGVAPAIHRVLEFSGVTRLGRVYNTQDEALAWLAREGGTAHA